MSLLAPGIRANFVSVIVASMPDHVGQALEIAPAIFPKTCLILPKGAMVAPTRRREDHIIEQMYAEMARIAAVHATCLQTPTAIPRLTIWHSHAPTDPTPAIFEPKFYILLSGRKRIVIGDRSIDFAPGDYAVSAVGVPFKGQVIEASPRTPYVGVELTFDPGVVANLLVETRTLAKTDGPALAIAQATRDLVAPLERLLGLLSHERDIAVLAPQLQRELYYRILQGSAGGTLQNILQQGTRFSQIEKAARWICDNAAQPMRIGALAASVGMSVTSFHRHFKAVTTHSPLAYQRHVRLLDAQRMLASGTGNATTAAYCAGYANLSQFSREFKRMFGITPGTVNRLADRGRLQA